MLELKTTYQKGILNIEMYGALDSLTAPDFKYWLTQKSAAGYHYFAINCQGLEFISSRGIGILSELNNILNGAQERLILYHVSNEVLNLLKFLQLSEKIPIAETYEQVKNTFAEKPVHKAAIRQPKPEAPVHTPAPEPEEQFSGIASDSKSSAPAELQKPETQREHQQVSSTATLHMESADEIEKLTPAEGEELNHQTDNEEYIDLTKIAQPSVDYDITTMNVIFCPNCGQSLRVSKKGLYLCPDCRSKFNYPF